MRTKAQDIMATKTWWSRVDVPLPELGLRLTLLLVSLLEVARAVERHRQ